MPKRFALLFLS